MSNVTFAPRADESKQTSQASQTDDKETASRRGGNEKSKYQLWPVTRKPTPSTTQGPSTRGGEQTLGMSISSPALRDASTSTSRRPSHKFKSKEASLISRRKRSIPEIGLGPMTTVQEAFLDSRKLSRRLVCPALAYTLQQRYQAGFPSMKDQIALQEQAGREAHLRSLVSPRFMSRIFRDGMQPRASEESTREASLHGNH